MKAFWACYVTSVIALIILKAFGLISLSWLGALIPVIIFVVICIVGFLVKRLDK